MKKTEQLNSAHTSKEYLPSYGTTSEELSPSEKIHQNDKNDLMEPAWKYRYVVTIVGFLIILLGSIHRTVMSIVIVAMVNQTAIKGYSTVKSESCSEVIANSTEDALLYSSRVKQDGEFNWSPEIQGYILGSLFIGSFVATMPSGRLAETYGCKFILFGSLLAASILTMLIPPFSRINALAVIAIQFLRGLTQAMTGPGVSILMANWSPKTERGFLYSLIQTAHPLGMALAVIFSGYVSESTAGWPCALYSIGGSGLALAIYIYLFIAENPKEHPHISEAELHYILSNQESKLSRKRPKLPWRKVLTSVPVYALLFSIFGRSWKYCHFSIVHSTFLGSILHYPIGQNGFFSAIPFLLAFVVSSIASWVSGYIEKKKIVSVDVLRKFWILISSLAFSLCLLGTYIAGCNRNMSVIFSVLSLGLAGMGTPGSMVVMQDMSPTFSGTLHSLTAVVGYIAYVMLPVMVGYLTDKNQTLEQWNKVFFISIGVVMSSAIAFAIFGSAKIQPWNFVEEESKKEVEEQSGNIKNEEKTSRL